MRSDGRDYGERIVISCIHLAQLQTKEEYKRKGKGEFEGRMRKYGELCDRVKKVMKFNN